MGAWRLHTVPVSQPSGTGATSQTAASWEVNRCQAWVCSRILGSRGLPRWRSGKEPGCQGGRCQRHRSARWVGKSLWRRKQQPPAVLLPEISPGQRSCPWTGLAPTGSQRVRCSWSHRHVGNHVAWTVSWGLRIFISWFKRESVGLLQLQRLSWEHTGPRTMGRSCL